MLPWWVAVAAFAGGTLWSLFLIYAVWAVGEELKGSRGGAHVWRKEDAAVALGEPQRGGPAALPGD